MTFYNRIESVRGIAIDLTNGRKWRGASDKAAVFDALDAARREYMRLSDENAKLREQLAKARDPQRIGGTADPESFVYAIEQLREFRWQHATNDEEAIPYINNVADAHERENAKLRELVEDMLDCIQIRAAFSRPPTEEMYEMFYKRVRELGVDE